MLPLRRQTMDGTVRLGRRAARGRLRGDDGGGSRHGLRNRLMRHFEGMALGARPRTSVLRADHARSGDRSKALRPRAGARRARAYPRSGRRYCRRPQPSRYVLNGSRRGCALTGLPLQQKPAMNPCHAPRHPSRLQPARKRSGASTVSRRSFWRTSAAKCVCASKSYFEARQSMNLPVIARTSARAPTYLSKVQNGSPDQPDLVQVGRSSPTRWRTIACTSTEPSVAAPVGDAFIRHSGGDDGYWGDVATAFGDSTERRPIGHGRLASSPTRSTLTLGRLAASRSSPHRRSTSPSRRDPRHVSRSQHDL